MRKGELAPPSGPTAAVDALSPRHALFWIAVAFSSFQIITAAYSPLPSQIVRAVHVGFLTLMVFGIEAERTAGSGWSAKRLLAWLAGAVAFALSFYHRIFQADLIQRSGEPTALDLAVGVVVLALLFDAARQIMGWALPLICLGSLDSACKCNV